MMVTVRKWLVIKLPYDTDEQRAEADRTVEHVKGTVPLFTVEEEQKNTTIVEGKK